MTLINQKNLLGENPSFLILYLLSGARQAGLGKQREGWAWARCSGEDRDSRRGSLSPTSQAKLVTNEACLWSN